ncbi:MAG: hypothetical protein ACI4YB_01855 [Oscillospiraceae bacterium]
MNNWEKWHTNALEAFKTHKATLIQDTERYCIIDWRKSDGDGEYYINFIVDKKRGSLIVSGDLGDSIATWYNPLTVSNLKSYIYKNIDYYMSKFQCSSDKYFYEEDYVFDSLIEHLEKENIDNYIENSYKFDDFQEFEEEIRDQICNSIRDDEFVPTNELYEIATDIDADAWEYLYTCGAQIKGRVYLWAIGFNMACEQLGL